MSQINIGKFWKKAITSSLQIIYWLKKKNWENLTNNLLPQWSTVIY